MQHAKPLWNTEWKNDRRNLPCFQSAGSAGGSCTGCNKTNTFAATRGISDRKKKKQLNDRSSFGSGAQLHKQVVSPLGYLWPSWRRRRCICCSCTMTRREGPRRPNKPSRTRAVKKSRPLSGRQTKSRCQGNKRIGCADQQRHCLETDRKHVHRQEGSSWIRVKVKYGSNSSYKRNNSAFSHRIVAVRTTGSKLILRLWFRIKKVRFEKPPPRE